MTEWKKIADVQEIKKFIPSQFLVVPQIAELLHIVEKGEFLLLCHHGEIFLRKIKINSEEKHEKM